MSYETEALSRSRGHRIFPLKGKPGDAKERRVMSAPRYNRWAGTPLIQLNCWIDTAQGDRGGVKETLSCGSRI